MKEEGVDNMKVDTLITLDDNVDCLVLDKAEVSDGNYFLVVALDEDSNPTTDVAIVKEVIENGEIYAEKVEDPEQVANLLPSFKYSMDAFKQLDSED